MPVITKSQARKLQKEIAHIRAIHYYNKKNSFIENGKQLLLLHQTSTGTKNKIKTTINIFKFVSAKLPYLIENCEKYDDIPNLYDTFVVTIQNKVTEIKLSYTTNLGWPDINQKLVNSLMSECAKADAMLKNIYSKKP